MKPKSKRQVLVCELSAKLPDLAKKLEPWAFKNCIRHHGFRNKMWTQCLSCGHVWPTTSLKRKTEICPGCNWKLEIETSRKLKSTDWARFAVMDVAGEFQIIRIFHIHCDMKAKNTPRVHTREIMQHWLLPNGDFEVISAVCGGMGLSQDHFGSGMSLKNRKDIWKYNIPVHKIYPSTALLPIFKRNGFTSAVKDIRPFVLLKNLATDSKVETLLKTKQYSLLAAYLGDKNSRVYRNWPSVRICIRSNYFVKDASIWLDHLDALNALGKDLLNAKFVCPENLLKEHNRIVAKRRAINLKRDLEKRKLEIALDEEKYQKYKSIFFGLIFTDKNLKIKVLESIKDFIHESEVHKHCIFSGRYYSKPSSLCFSAQINGKSVETIEVCLSSFTVIQSRGLQNKSSEYNKRILDLISKNMTAIKKRMDQANSKAA